MAICIIMFGESLHTWFPTKLNTKFPLEIAHHISYINAEDNCKYSTDPSTEQAGEDGEAQHHSRWN